MVTVRHATAEDAAALLSISVAAIRAFGPDVYDDEQVAAWATTPDGVCRYRESIGREAELVLVAEADDGWRSSGGPAGGDRRERGGADDAEGGTTVIGFGTLDVDGGEVSAVYVHPDHARGGVGTALLERLEARAREAGLGELSLWASLNAVGFYECRGYDPLGAVNHRTTGGVELPCLEMRKCLDAPGGGTTGSRGAATE